MKFGPNASTSPQPHQGAPLKSPLNKAALTPKKLSNLLEEQVTYIEYDADGNLTDIIALVAMNALTITSVEIDKLIGLNPIGWETSWPFEDYGVVPLSSGGWSRRCVVPLSVGLQLRETWTNARREKNGYQRTMLPSGYQPRVA